MRRRGPWSRQETERFLAETRVPIRIAGNGSNGHPLLASLWFAPLEDRLWCATRRSSRLAVVLERDGRCAFEVSEESIPYRGIRGRGTATLHDDRGAEILRLLIDRQLGGAGSRLARDLLDRAEGETAIAIAPESLFSWDFRERMADVGSAVPRR